jgi:NACHT domain
VRRRVRIGWGLVALAVVAVAVIVTVGGLRAHGPDAFNRWVGLATIAALPLTALGVLLVLWDKIKGTSDAPQQDGASTEDELAAVVLAQAQVARSRLIGADEPDDQAANVRFAKGSGRFREVGGANDGNLESVLEYYDSLSPRRLVVLGEPGAGKTVLVMQLLIKLLNERKHDTSKPVPVLISAAAYDTSLAWDKWLAGHLALRFGIGAEIASRLVRDGRILPVVDGVDEMDPVGEPVRAGVLVATLNASMRGQEKAPVVVTCRLSEYQALVREIDRATHIEMLPLTSDEAVGYLQDQFLNQDEQQRWEPVVACLRANPDGPLATQLATPWRLTLALAAFRDEGDPSSLLPPVPRLAGAAAKNYAQRVDSFLLGRYISSAVHLHDPDRRYTEQKVQRWMTALANGLAWQARHNKSATDIQLDQWWQPVGRKITQLSHMVVSAVPGLTLLAVAVFTHNPRAAPIAAVPILLTFFAGYSISPSRLKARQIAGRRRELAVGLAVGVAVGVVFGVAGGIVFALLARAGFRLVAIILGGLVGGLAFLLVGILASRLRDTSPQGLTPRDVIRADSRYGLVYGVALGIAGGIALGVATALDTGVAKGLVYGVAFGLALGIAFGLAQGAQAWTRYHICIVAIAVRQQGPLRFGAFLDWAQQAGLLRVSGVAYQFRHRQLQDWLTSRDSQFEPADH